MRLPISLALPVSLVTIGILAGCQREAPTAAPDPNGSQVGADARQQAYERELLALKAAVHDQKALEARHRDLLVKYGYPLPEMESEGAQALPAARALPKTASTGERLVKNSVGSIYRTFRTEILVPEDTRLAVNVYGKDAADPFLAAFYAAGGDAVRYVIVRDDDTTDASGTGTLNPSGTWYNATGSDQTVVIVVFAALTSARGAADMSYKIGYDSWQAVYGIRVGGTVQYENQDFDPVPAGCVDAPTGSRFAFKVNSGSNSVQLLSFSNDSYGGIEKSAKTSWTQAVSDWIPPGAPFSKSPLGGDRRSNHHFVLASRASTIFGSTTVSGGYSYNQIDLYDNCD